VSETAHCVSAARVSDTSQDISLAQAIEPAMASLPVGSALVIDRSGTPIQPSGLDRGFTLRDRVTVRRRGIGFYNFLLTHIGFLVSG
jgi:hypothetical protein